MTSRFHRLRFWLPCLILLILTLPFITSACMWGFVTDASTGAPVKGAIVTVEDSKGNFRFTTTNALGVYAFDSSSGPSLALGDARICVSSPDKGGSADIRTIDYADNPNASFADPSTFREVQNLKVPGKAGLYHDLVEGYTIQFPDNWVITPVPILSSDVNSFIEASGVSSNMEFGMCSIESDPLPPGGLPTHWFLNIPADQAKITERTNDTLGGRPAVRFVLNLHISTAEFTGNVVADTWVFVRSPELWMVMCMADPKDFPGEEFMLGNIAESFKFDQ